MLMRLPAAARRALPAATRSLAAAWLVLAAAPAGAQGGGPSAPSAADTAVLLGEARAFMAAYARDIVAGDRAAIGARYDPAGAYQMGMGRKAFRSQAQIVARYAGPGWQRPASFAWRDLSYEALGPDVVLVAGQFDWSPRAGERPVRFSYSGVLRRRDGQLRIRLEDESADPAVYPPRPAPGAARRDTAG